MRDSVTRSMSSWRASSASARSVLDPWSGAPAGSPLLTEAAAAGPSIAVVAWAPGGRLAATTARPPSAPEGSSGPAPPRALPRMGAPRALAASAAGACTPALRSAAWLLLRTSRRAAPWPPPSPPSPGAPNEGAWPPPCDTGDWPCALALLAARWTASALSPGLLDQMAWPPLDDAGSGPPTLIAASAARSPLLRSPGSLGKVAWPPVPPMPWADAGTPWLWVLPPPRPSPRS
mmetsp:Transcript_9272/g.26072  ORF Transcript_9272/g.26072 Transcript_9272/m.26072 type:complete len:233 (+) Transcript_9272:446-1144(+)